MFDTKIILKWLGPTKHKQLWQTEMSRPRGVVTHSLIPAQAGQEWGPGSQGNETLSQGGWVRLMFSSLVLNWVLPMASITKGLRMEEAREFTPQRPSQTIFMNCLIPMSPQFCQAVCHEPGKGVPLDGRQNKVLGWLALRHWVTPWCFINTAHASVSRPVTRFSKDLVCFQRELWLNGALPTNER